MRLIDHHWDDSHIDTDRLEPAATALELRRFVADLVAGLVDQAQVQDVEMDVLVEHGLPIAVVADEKSLREVLLNLLNIALKLIGKGRVTLRVNLLDPSGDGGFCRLRFTVEGTVPDMGGEGPQHGFEPFDRGSPQGQNQGADPGLIVADRLVHMLGGSLQAEREPGRGCRFRFDLAFPVVEEENSESAEEDGFIRGYRGRQRRVLAVDDNELDRLLLLDLLKPLGFAVDLAPNGREGVEMARRAPPDLILLDVLMPGMDGYGVLESLRRDPQLASIPVVAITADVSRHHRDKARQMRQDGFVAKPIEPDALVELIGRLLGLTWRYEGQMQPNAAVAAMLVQRPPREQLTEFEALLEVGRFAQASIWLEALERQTPKYSGFCRRAQALIQDLNEAGLRRLIGGAGQT